MRSLVALLVMAHVLWMCIGRQASMLVGFLKVPSPLNFPCSSPPSSSWSSNKVLGLEVPPTLLALADEVIE
jgi:hypothetical protein